VLEFQERLLATRGLPARARLFSDTGCDTRIGIVNKVLGAWFQKTANQKTTILTDESDFRCREMCKKPSLIGKQIVRQTHCFSQRSNSLSRDVIQHPRISAMLIEADFDEGLKKHN
jgi:hypothetical protein